MGWLPQYLPGFDSEAQQREHSSAVSPSPCLPHGPAASPVSAHFTLHIWFAFLSNFISLIANCCWGCRAHLQFQFWHQSTYKSSPLSPTTTTAEFQCQPCPWSILSSAAHHWERFPLCHFHLLTCLVVSLQACASSIPEVTLYRWITSPSSDLPGLLLPKTVLDQLYVIWHY